MSVEVKKEQTLATEQPEPDELSDGQLDVAAGDWGMHFPLRKGVEVVSIPATGDPDRMQILPSTKAGDEDEGA